MVDSTLILRHFTAEKPSTILLPLEATLLHHLNSVCCLLLPVTTLLLEETRRPEASRLDSLCSLCNLSNLMTTSLGRLRDR